MLNEISWGKIWEFLRFSIVGFSNTAISYITFSLIFFLTSWHHISIITAYIIAMLNSYYFNKIWVFRAEEFNRRVLFQFIFINMVTLSINLLLMEIFVQKVDISPYVSQIFCTLVVMVVSYVFYGVIFRKTLN